LSPDVLKFDHDDSDSGGDDDDSDGDGGAPSKSATEEQGTAAFSKVEQAAGAAAAGDDDVGFGLNKAERLKRYERVYRPYKLTQFDKNFAYDFNVPIPLHSNQEVG
jgi:hypothetical protein